MKTTRIVIAVLLVLAAFSASAVAFSTSFGSLYSTVDFGDTQSVTLTVDSSVNSDATLNLTLYGDLGSGGTFEGVEVTIDGVSVGTVDSLGSDCTVVTRTLSIPASTLAPLAADGQVVLAFTSGFGVDAFCSGSASPFSSGSSLAFAVQGSLTYTSATPSWTITSSASPTVFASTGDTIEYRHTVRNTGNVTITNIRVTGSNTGPITCDASSLTPGQSMTCNSRYSPTPEDVGSDIDYEVTASGRPATGDLQETSASGRIRYEPQPRLSVAATPSPATFSAAGEVIAHAFQVANSGNVPIMALTLTGTRTGDISCAQTTLGPREQTTCTSQDATTADDLGADIAFSVTATGTPQAGTLAGVTVRGAITFIAHPSLSLSVTASPAFSRPNQAITYTFRVTNNGNVPLTAIAVADSLVRDVTCPTTALALGAATSCTGTYTTTVDDVLAGHVVSVATASAVYRDAAVSSPAVTTDMRIDAEIISAVTHAAIGNFMNHRADMVVSMAPDLSPMHARLSSSLAGTSASTRGAPSPFQIAGSGDDRMGRFAFALSRAMFAQAGQRGPAPTSNAASPGADLWNVWAEGAASWFTYDAGDRVNEGTGGVFYAGADRRISPAVLVGGLVQFDWMSERTAALDLDASGRGWMAGPYVSMRPAAALFVDARAAWGTSSNEVDPIGVFTDEFSTTRTLLSAKATGRWSRRSLQAKPNAEITYFRDTQANYTNRIGVSIPELTSSLGRFTFGPEFAYPMTMSGGVTLEPYAGLDGVWDFARTADRLPDGTPLGRDRFRARVEFGTSSRAKSGLTVGGAFSYDGIGSHALSAKRARLWVVVPM